MLLHILSSPSRTLALQCTRGSLLVLRASPNKSGELELFADFFPTVEDYEEFEEMVSSDDKEEEQHCYVCLGVLKVGEDIFLVIATKIEFAHAEPPIPESSGLGIEPVYRVLDVELHSFTSSNLSLTPATKSPFDHPARHIHEILKSQSFYFSHQADLTSRLSTRISRLSPKYSPPFFELAETLSSTREDTDDGKGSDLICDPSFMFNYQMLSPLLGIRDLLKSKKRDQDWFDRAGFTMPIIQGFVGTTQVILERGLGESIVGIVRVISRLCWRRTGTRFNCRGADEEGWAANFVETETILRTPTSCYSQVQLRGSVPILWTETPSPPPKTSPIQLGPLDVSYAPLTRHLYFLLNLYPSHKIHLVSLLRTGSPPSLVREKVDQIIYKSPQKDLAKAVGGRLGCSVEVPLSDAFKHLVKESRAREEELKKSVKWSELDWIGVQALTGFNGVKGRLRNILLVDEFLGGATVLKIKGGEIAKVVSMQTRVVRFNCRDCLDRTNMAQSIASLDSLDMHVQHSFILHGFSTTQLKAAHRVLFSENGDALSTIHSGTGALYSNSTRTGTQDPTDIPLNAAKVQERMDHALNTDTVKQKAIDQLLGYGQYRLTPDCFPVDELYKKYSTDENTSEESVEDEDP